MRIKLVVLVVISIATLLLSGCASKGAYDSQVQENQLLSKNLDEAKGSLLKLQEQHDALAEASVTQGEELKALSAEAAELKLKNEKLKEALKPGNLLGSLSAFIAALQQQLDQLKAENSDLKGREAAAQESPVEAVPVVTEPTPVSETVETPVEASMTEAVAEPELDTEPVPVDADPVTTDLESVPEPVEAAPATEEVLEVTDELASETPAEEGVVESK
jgi:hypothetical protein